MIEGIAFALFICLILVAISKKFTLPPIPLYIIAGILIGTSGLGIVEQSEVSDFLTQLGLLFLLFTMGLELKPDEVAAKGTSFLASGAIDFCINGLIGFAAALLLGFPLYDAIVMMSAFYISSSAMAFSSLIENRRLIFKESETVIWLMVFEDLVLVLIMIVLSTSERRPIVDIALIILMVGGIFGISYLLRDYIKALLSRSDEMPFVFTFILVLAAAGVAEFLSVPDTIAVIALGSALSMIEPRSFERAAKPYRDVFLIVFFVFFGISVNFTGGFSLILLLGLGLLAILSKLVSGLCIGRVFHGSWSSGMEIFSHSASRGEFSIALAGMFGSPVIASTVASMVVITSLIGGFLGKYSGRLRKVFRKKVRDKDGSGII